MLFGLERNGRIVEITADMFNLSPREGDSIVSGENINELLERDLESSENNENSAPTQIIRAKKAIKAYLIYQ